jgi:WxL domain surface cell wall-binding
LTPNANTRLFRERLLASIAVVCALLVLAPATAVATTAEDKTQFSVTAGSLSFSTVPALPTLSSITLNGAAQTTNSTMTNFGVADATGSGSGWNTTVAGQSGSEKSAVFAQYCPTATCGTDSKGYVPSGATLAANSLTLISTGASFAAQSGSTGTAPTLQCSSACNVDSASAVKIASAAASAGMGTWLTTGFAATSLALSTPSTLKALSNGEVYRANLLWTLSTGP